MTLTRTPRALSPQGFYGWHVVAYSAIALAATGPGQTVGVSMFIDPVIQDLGISRSAISLAYLVGTLAGALALPWIGRALDKYGVRRTMAVIGFAFGLMLVALSFASNIWGLTAGFVGIRMAGQGALGLTATTAVALWFDRKRGMAAGLVSAFGAVGISTTPLFLEGIIADHGWRTAWMLEGIAVWIIVVPLAIFAFRDRPADLGQMPDGAAVDHSKPLPLPFGYTRAQALRQPYFWLIASAVAVTGLLTTAVAFHQISLLMSRGLTASEAAANFIPQTIAGLIATLASGYLIDRFAGRWMIVASMGTLATALLWATMVEPGLSAIGFGMVLGTSASTIRTVETAAFPRYFGTKHIGAIRGLVVAISVAGTALGPLAYAIAFDGSGSYVSVLLGSAAIPVAIAVWAVVLAEPSRLVAAQADSDDPPHYPGVDAADVVIGTRAQKADKHT